ncbi:DUF397 domain-containing protein [Actinomadura formosensis]|uniref:DUF397 domain-containing protein n=1 Tax=Actinomadura formosensis TaxID=60706 RepID=UPI003898E4BB
MGRSWRSGVRRSARSPTTSMQEGTTGNQRWEGRMSTSNLSSVHWRKSSHSGSEGGNCIEVASWRKSSRSDVSGGACV